MVKDQQVRRLIEVRHKHDYQYQAADAAGMSSKTAGKYLQNGKLPSQCRVEHTWPTRQDPFAEDWDFVKRLLQDTQAALEAKTLFAYLQRAYPGKYHDGQLRPLQRHIKAWKALYGPAKEVFFSQHYDPGQWSCSDFTSMNQLAITIAQRPFDHLFYHFVLCYSNWQAGRICFSESFESLSLGVQDALWKLGGVPFYHRTDNLTSAVHKVGHPDIFTNKYRGLADHYGFESSKTNPASPHENGDVEKSNDLFKKAVDQSLILRGSRDFDTMEAYEKFLQKIIDRMNQNCHKRFAEEIGVLKPLPNLRYDDYETKTCKVGRGGTIRLLHNTYSVHSRLVGETVTVRVYADTLELWYAQRHIETLPRLRGENGHCINSRLLTTFGSYRNIKNINFHDAQTFINSLELLNLDKEPSDSTRLKHLTNAKILFNQALKWDFLRKNPFHDISITDISKEDWYPIKPAEFQALLKAIDHIPIRKSREKEDQKRIIRTKAFYSVMYGCGLRFGEAINLWWDKNIDWTHNKIHIKNRKAKDGFPPFSIKNHQDRSIPAPQWVMDSLKELKKISHRNNPYVFLTEDRLLLIKAKWSQWKNEDKVNRWKNSVMVNNTNRDFVVLCRRAGIISSDRLSVHCLRKGYGTNLADLNTPVHTLKSLMGHSNIQTTMKFYIQNSDANSMQAVRKLEEMMGGGG